MEDTTLVTPKKNTAAVDEVNNCNEIAKISVKIPPFWRKNVKVWLMQVESQFITARITNEITKYHYILGSLDTDVADSISDHIIKPLSTTPYSDLKQKLIDEFEPSSAQKISSLLNDLSLGDKKPSLLLREMKHLVGDNMSDTYLKSMFMQHLPLHMRSALITVKGDAECVAKFADEMYHATQINQVETIGHRDISNDIVNKIEELSLSVDEIKKQLNKQTNKTFNNTKTICWYHKNFKNKASKCIPPCTFQTSNTTTSNLN